MSDVSQGENWWQASDGKWYSPETHPDYKPPPPSNPAPPPIQPERPTATAAFVCGVIGAIIGLIPLLGILAIPLGIIALVLGIMGWRRKPERSKLARAATILCAIAIALGVIGVVIVDNAVDDLNEVFNPDLDPSPVSPEDDVSADDLSDDELRDALYDTFTDGDRLDNAEATCLIDYMFANSSRAELNRLADAEVEELSEDDIVFIQEGIMECQ